MAFGFLRIRIRITSYSIHHACMSVIPPLESGLGLVVSYLCGSDEMNINLITWYALG